MISPALRPFALGLTLVLTACGGADDATPRLAITTGNGQTVVQHTSLPESIVMTVTDASGQPLPGVTLSLAPAPGSSGFGIDWPFTRWFRTVSGSDGRVTWNSSFHDVGRQRIVVSATGLQPVTIEVDVTPSTHAFDGPYLCSVSAFPAQGQGAFENRLLPLIDGSQPDIATTPDFLLPDPFQFINSAQVDEATGNITAGMRLNTSLNYAMTGHITPGPSGTATLDGTYEATFNGRPVPEQGSGTWSCVRF